MKNSFRSASARNLGFTIVELLIVIVIIAILSTLAVVAFSGSNLRAQNAQIATALKQWEGIMINYKTLKGDYYTTAYGCQPLLGSSASDFTDQGGCTATYDATFMNELRTTLGVTLPKGRLPNFGVLGQGIRYWGTSAPYLLEYNFSGTVCASPSDTLWLSSGTVVRCRRYLP
jgi:prepilin-type N-terminal cleavage/methylation domain-containing protein